MSYVVRVCYTDLVESDGWQAPDGAILPAFARFETEKVEAAVFPMYGGPAPVVVSPHGSTLVETNTLAFSPTLHWRTGSSLRRLGLA